MNKLHTFYTVQIPKLHVERILHNYEMAKLSTTEELPGISNAK